jgi:prolyl oligopeptidase
MSNKHPAHARKLVKKLWDEGQGKDWPVYYYENIEGGHGGAAVSCLIGLLIR